MNGHTRNRASGRNLLATTALAAGLCGLGAATTLAATQVEAETLRRDIENFVSDPGFAGWSFRTAGAITVNVVDDGYNALIPQPVLVYDQPAADVRYGDPVHFEILLDDLNIRMVPDPVDLSLYGVEMWLGGGSLFGGGDATRLRVVGQEGGAFIDIARHSVSGTWSTEIGSLISSEIAFEDIVAMPDPDGSDAPDARISVGAIRGNSDVLEVEPGLWDGEGTTVIENFVAEIEGDVPFRFAEFTLTQAVGGFAFADYMEWVATSPMMMGEEPDFASEAEAQAYFKQQVLDIPTLMDDFSLGWSITDLEAGEPGERVLIERHEFALSAEGLADDVSDWHLRLFAQGMTVPSPEVPAQFVPTVFDIDLNFNGVPTGLGWQALEDAMGGTEFADMEDLGPMLGQQMLQLALQSQTGMDMSGEIDWETGNIRFTGSVEADPASPLMASGGLSVVVNEMQEFIREVEETMGAEPASALTMIQALGQQQDGEAGPETVYDFQISGTNLLMNGQDLEPIMMLLGQ